MTFREAYLRTGRILNISVIPADRHSSVSSLSVKILLISSVQANQVIKLRYCTGYGHLERVAGLSSSTWYTESSSADAETQGWSSCTVELGKQV